MDDKKKVLIGMPNGSGVVPMTMVSSLLQLQKPVPCAFIGVERLRVEKARNYLVQQCLEGGFDYLFMVDDDNPIPPETLITFINDDKDIVIAPILGRHPDEKGNFKMCAFYVDPRLVGDKTLRYYEPIKEFKDTGPLHRIDAGGTGCMLIKRKVLETLRNTHEMVFEFGDITVNGQRRTMSEDVEFCERAVDAGFEVWLDDRIRPTHIISPRAVQWVP